MGRDSIKNYREWHRLNAITLVKAWTETSLKDFQEPIRKGLKRGTPIGFGLSKMKAVHYAAAYPMALKTPEIASFCGISQGLVGVWRTEEAFERKVVEIHRSLGELIGEDLKIIFESADRGRDFNEKSLHFRSPSLKDAGDYYDYWTGLLPFLAETVADWVFYPIKKRIKSKKAGSNEKLFFFEVRNGVSRIRTPKELRDWEKKQLKVTEAMIDRCIDLLAEGKGDADFKENLKGFVFDKLEILAYA
jgi:hypothetical protein